MAASIPGTGRFWGRLWHPRHWLTWIGAGLTSLVYLLPFRWRDTIAAAFAQLFYQPESRQIETARTNLRLCYPQWSDTRIEEFLRDYFTRYIQVLAQSPAIWWCSRQHLWERLDVRGLAYLDNIRAEGRPVILLFNHALAVDTAALGLSTRFSLCGIYKPFENEVVEWLFRRSRERFGSALVTRGQTLRSTLKGLQEGTMLVYLCDEDFGPQGSVFAPFFGQQKATLTMLPKLARHAGARVVPVFPHYDPVSGQVIVDILPECTDYPTDNEQQNALRLNQALQNMIEICPEQYLWKLRLFRTGPEGIESRYT